MSQLFEWLQIHAKQLLFRSSQIMKLIENEFIDTRKNLFSVILTTLKQEEIDSFFIELLEYYIIILVIY